MRRDWLGLRFRLISSKSGVVSSDWRVTIICRALDGANAGEMALTFTPNHVRAGAARGLEYARLDS
jgi:hypothetical protein